MSLKALVRRRRLRYDAKNEYFYFPATKDLRTQSVSYESIHRQASREVFKMYFSKSAADRMAYCRHSAFRGHFLSFEERWFLEITPTYHFTYDGAREDRYREERLKGIKRLERNPAVLGQIMMWCDFLRRDRDELFGPRYPYLSFGELATVAVDATLPDEEWYTAEDASGRQDLSARDNNLDLYEL